MVSFWPFKGDDQSAASFEKVLSQLSTKINKASAQNDSLRQKQRRYKVLWTLYSTFAYILVAAILTLVTGYQRWSALEYSAIAGSPVLIFGIRTALDAYYNYRISGAQAHLNALYKQRETAITKLKAATKYDSTQQLLDKYGGTPGKRGASPQPPKKRKLEGGQSKQSAPQGPRTGFAPPPTANIQRAPSAGARPPQGALQPRSRNASGLAPEAAALMPSHDEPREDFAPNAFSAPSKPAAIRQQSTQYSEGPKWYDRIMDVVLGEDETQAKNRMALICDNCRLVNGQAPPGARTLEDVGKWRCSSCHAWNGVESEEKRMLKQITGEAQSPVSPTSAVSESTPHPISSEDESRELEHVDEDVGEDEDDSTSSTPAGSTRSKARQRTKA
ncbi:hypothetical protein LTR36_000713 [Oleoguttula mirabilis]|uniref:Endoplasmic reticulum junction formation protein lunapark n=1 Tax=Oleoguttula mirabilis TaxID=1507867 RepID=A0AAV9JRV9_9PEZI|nr:hypothetical protein LTR36_000713 [Oleoguttula mirabilis]